MKKNMRPIEKVKAYESPSFPKPEVKMFDISKKSMSLDLEQPELLRGKQNLNTDRFSPADK